MMSNKTDLTITITPTSRRLSDLASTSSSPFAKKERVRCMFCGGDQCSKCGIHAHQKLEKPGIPNLHSHWINESILAMQRPSDILLEEYGVLESFKKANITAVFNLTEPGEHPYCGPGVLPHSGFPYTPEKLMKAGIKHFNFNWPDMTAPTVAMMMEIAYIGAAELNRGGKIAVHCHAGFGRTGMAIACILIFKDQVESGQVITFIRNRRPGSIQTATQGRFIVKFEKSFRFLMQSFPTRDSLELSSFALTSPRSGHSSNSNSVSFSSGRSSLHLTAPLSPLRGFGSSSIRSIHSNSVSATASGAGGSNGGNGNGPASPPQGVGGLSTITENTNTSLYLKTLKQSVQDQYYLLSPIEQASRTFQCVHKIVHFTSMAIVALCKDHVGLAQLGITGLNKLVPKENTSHKFTSNLSKHNMSVLMNAPSYMVATNSMTQGLEETILTDIKIELNVNKWTRFMSVADVVAISLTLGQDSVRRLTKVTSTIAEELSPTASYRASPAQDSAAGGATTPTSIGGVSSRLGVRANSMYRNNNFKETSDADYNKSKRVSANIMSQLLIDWLETRQQSVFDASLVVQLHELWFQHYPNFGQLGWATPAWRELKARTRAYVTFEDELLQLLRAKLDRYRQHALGSVVAMYQAVHRAGCEINGEDAENEAPVMDTLAALRLSIALMHGRKQQHLLVRNRALNMELVKLFILRHVDAEPVIINSITFANVHAEPIAQQLGVALVTTLEVLVRTLQLLQEIGWAPEVRLEDKVCWRDDAVQKFTPV